MSLRNLSFNVDFTTNTRPVIEMNSAVDEVRDSAIETTEAIQGVDNATENLGKTSGSVGKTLQDNWKQVTLVAGSAGLVLEGMARTQSKLTEQTQRLSASLNMTEKEMRELVLSTTDVTFPLEDVLDLFETGRQQGIRSAEQLKEYAEFWDMVGDATGEASTKLAESSAGLRAVGIQAGQESKALASFGYITENSTASVSDLLTFLERTGPQLRELGLDINDTTAIMGILEHEMGMTSQMARTEFRKAVNEADGDVALMLHSLNISIDTFQDYQSAVESSSDIIERNAKTHEETYTIMQRLQQGVKELFYANAPFLQQLADLAPLLLALGPAMKIVSAGQKMYNAVSALSIPILKAKALAIWSTTTALLANPITWVIVGIVALVGALWMLWKNWDTVSDYVVGAFIWVRERVNSILEAIVNFLSGIGEKIWAVVTGIFETLKGIFLKFHPIGIIISHWDEIMEFLGNIDLKEIGINIMTSLASGIKNMAENVIDSAVDVVRGISDRVKGFFRISSPSELFMEYGGSIMKGLASGISSMGKEAIESARAVVRGISDRVKGFFGISSPSELFIEYGLNLGEGLEEGIKKSTPDYGLTDSFNQMSISDRPLSGAVNNSSSMTFAPNIEINVGAGADAEEVANNLENAFDELMIRYSRKLELRNPAITTG